MWLINIFTTLASFIAMEAVAWLTHKYVMHGLLWKLHEDHHKKNPSSFFEKNDNFFLIFALPGIACLALGVYTTAHLLFYIGLGITLYGMAYFTVHDIFIHQRFKLLRNTNNFYFRAIRRAHKMHHKHLEKEDGECFGMLFVPMKYFKEAMKKETKATPGHA
ncbi:sterol desaturase family protein [Nemorincola caseinilytica]|uniref:Sterol desaturase family protein n=1 Tax=Nemorincola caseinilytica TaxID=2054315 RepID=A0ABP8NNF0_9BACT